jgi:diketogulonate reductase-like aldo/keto reductase
MLHTVVRLVTTYVAAPSTQAPKHPPILYGTAWKKERTRELVLLALKTGFRGIDTACQPRHYDEAAVGAAIEQSGCLRSELFLQTKFTPLSGQDPEQTPYDRDAPLEEQVKQSVAASLRNLRTTHIDCLVLHSPLPTHAETLRVWRAMEKVCGTHDAYAYAWPFLLAAAVTVTSVCCRPQHVAAGEVRSLGVSNAYDATVLAELYAAAAVKPSCVQNRWVAETRHDESVRRWCRQQQPAVQYQSFWTITGNRKSVDGRVRLAAGGLHAMERAFAAIADAAAVWRGCRRVCAGDSRRGASAWLHARAGMVSVCAGAGYCTALRHHERRSA